VKLPTRIGPIGRLVAIAAGVLAARTAAADGIPADQVVDVVIAADPASAALLEIALREPLQRQGVRVRWMRVEWFELSDVVVPDPSAPAALARAWFDMVGISRRPGDPPGPVAVVYLTDGPWDRILVRTVPFDRGLDEVTREELCQILASGVEGIRAGATPGRPRDEVRAELGVALAPMPVEQAPPPPALPPPTTPADLLTLDLAVDYAVVGFSGTTLPAHRFGLQLGLAERSSTVRFGGWLLGGYQLPLEVERDGVGVRIDTGMLRLLGTAELPLGSWFALHLAVGAGVDVARVEPQRTGGAAVQLEPVSTETSGVLLGQFAGRFVLGGGLAVWLGVGVDIDPVPRRYVIDRAGTRETVLEPWLARPFGFVRLSYDLLDGARTL
jgi:hypothetical protein